MARLARLTDEQWTILHDLLQIEIESHAEDEPDQLLRIEDAFNAFEEAEVVPDA